MARRDDPLDERERELVREVYGPLWRFASVVGPREVEPDDLVQEAFLRILRRGSLSDLDEPLAYLRRTVLNLAANHRRLLRRRRLAHRRLLTTDSNQGIPAYPSDLADLFALSPEARAVLYLAEVEGYPYRDIARMLGCTEAAARKRASRARHRLKEAVTGEIS